MLLLLAAWLILTACAGSRTRTGAAFAGPPVKSCPSFPCTAKYTSGAYSLEYVIRRTQADGLYTVEGALAPLAADAPLARGGYFQLALFKSGELVDAVVFPSAAQDDATVFAGEFVSPVDFDSASLVYTQGVVVPSQNDQPGQ